jgi:predicted PurR-regulated permease PerM
VSPLQKTNTLLSVFIAAGLIYLLSPILTPFLIAIFLAYLGNPLVDALQRWHCPRILGASLVFIGILLILLTLVGFLFPLLAHQIRRFLASLPAAINWLQQTVLPWLSQHLDFQLPEIKSLNAILTEHWHQAGKFANIAWKTLTQSSITLLGWLANLLLIPVVTFYLLSDWPRLTANLRSLLPRRLEPFICQLFSEFDTVLSAFFRGQLLVMLALGIFYSLGLWVVGLDLALLIGVIAGLFTVVPYLGFIVGIISASIAAFIQFQDWTHVFYVWIVFAIGNVLENVILVPLLIGDRIGLHPITVLFAVFCGGQLFGFLGVLLALPVAAVSMVLLRHLRTEYIQSSLYR